MDVTLDDASISPPWSVRFASPDGGGEANLRYLTVNVAGDAGPYGEIRISYDVNVLTDASVTSLIADIWSGDGGALLPAEAHVTVEHLLATVSAGVTVMQSDGGSSRSGHAEVPAVPLGQWRRVDLRFSISTDENSRTFSFGLATGEVLLRSPTLLSIGLGVRGKADDGPAMTVLIDNVTVDLLP